MSKKAILIGSLDTKGEEFTFIKEELERIGTDTFMIDTGILDDPLIPPDISNNQVAIAGGMSIEELRRKNDRGTAVTVMAKGIAKIMDQLVQEGIVGGVFGMGGTAGTTIGASAMKVVPIGVPKVLLSTVASGNTRPYIGQRDIMMMNSVVDVAGINGLSRMIFKNAAHALSGMIDHMDQHDQDNQEKPMIGVSMFGVTTPCATKVRQILEEKGYDVLVFHATGSGGQAMEELIKEGFIEGVADLTTTELADELVGGIFSAGAERLEVAGEVGTPQVISVGALDMVNFGPPETVPATFKDRNFYRHNPTTTLMRTTIEENRKLGEMIAEKLNKSIAPTTVVFPKGGVSLLDMPSKEFEGTKERETLYHSIKSNLKKDVSFIETDKDINHPDTAILIANQLLTLLSQSERKET